MFTTMEQLPPIPETDEQCFIAALRAGQDDAYERLVRDYGGRLWQIVRRILPQESDCDEAVQRTFIAAFRSLGGFAGQSTLATWLHRIAVNESLMLLRKRSRSKETTLDDLLPRFDETGHYAQPTPAWPPLPESELESRETREMVRRCVDQLPDDYRTVIVLRDLEELSTDETAERLGTTTGAVKTRLHRARQALRTLLERELMKQGRLVR